jgi:heat shock protein HtpX
VAVLVGIAPIEIPPAVGFVAVVLLGASMLLWALTQIDTQWPPGDVSETSSELLADVGRELGRRIGRLEARSDSKTVGAALAALALVFGTSYGAIIAFDLGSENVLTALSLFAGSLFVGPHHARVVRRELDEAAVLRRFREDFDSERCPRESADHAALDRRVQRLAAQVDLPAPTVRLVGSRTPAAAAIGYRLATSTIVVSTELLEELDDRELEEVLAHEVAHVANRDAAVLTLLSAPGAAARETIDRQGGNPIIAVPAAVMVATSRFCAALVARSREYAADDGAVAITGDPAALASALETLDRGVAGRPTTDLRGSAAAFSIVPVPWSEQRFVDLSKRALYRRILGTHPRTRRRLERLERWVQALDKRR